MHRRQLYYSDTLISIQPLISINCNSIMSNSIALANLILVPIRHFFNKRKMKYDSIICKTTFITNNETTLLTN